MRAIAGMLLSSIITSTIAAEFDAPWLDPKVALVIDPYYANSIDWDKLASEPRVIAVIHKSTIGTDRLDSAYFARKKEAIERGYLWGSYHWGVAGNPEQQADYYIDKVKPEEDELIALDLEDAASKKLMSADEAVRFIERVKQRVGRYPVLYTNHASAMLISSKYQGSAFSKTPLWYARFKSKVNDFPVGVWSSYTLWQFSSEIKLQMPIPGVKSDMDINAYNGTIEQLRATWPLTK